MPMNPRAFFDTLLPLGYSKAALILALEYEVDCEAYDRTLPGFAPKGAPEEWIPAGIGRSASYVFARQRAERMRDEAQRLHIDGAELRAASKVAERLSFHAQQRELAQLRGPCPNCGHVHHLALLCGFPSAPAGFPKEIATCRCTTAAPPPPREVTHHGPHTVR
jgi:hypothetical protein